MDKSLFSQGKSLRQISRDTNKCLSTVRYWFHKYRLNLIPKTPIIPDETLTTAVSMSRSCAHALRILGRSYVGSNYRFLKRNIRRLNLNTSHWKTHGVNKPRILLNNVLIENSPYHLDASKRKRILRDKLLINICALCNMDPVWNGKPLTLRLDHINGKNKDHRIENLRFVCPNCDSQLPTYCSKNKVFQRLINLTGLK